MRLTQGWAGPATQGISRRAQCEACAGSRPWGQLEKRRNGVRRGRKCNQLRNPGRRSRERESCSHKDSTFTLLLRSWICSYSWPQWSGHSEVGGHVEKALVLRSVCQHNAAVTGLSGQECYRPSQDRSVHFCHTPCQERSVLTVLPGALAMPSISCCLVAF